MGLGKTVMLLALILASKQERQQQQQNAGLTGKTKTTPASPSATLIVVKLSMLPQWQDEIQSKTNLTYNTYYGSGSNNATTMREFHNVDIVLTTYGTIQGEAALRRATASKKQPVLLQHEWLRVILDEAHCIKNTATLASKACCNLRAQYRWCVSGTIIQNSVEDLFGLLKFLHHEPWCLSPFWKAAITKPMLTTMAAANTATTTAGDASKNNDSSNPQDKDKMYREREEAVRMVLGRLRRILAPIMLRRTKDSRTLDGKPILTLPPVETQVVHVELLPAEREFYNGVLARSLTLFEGFVDSGTAARSYLQILSMISRLRQTCDHIALTVRTRMEDEDWNAAIFESNDDGCRGNVDDNDVKPRSKEASVTAVVSKSSRSSGASSDAIGKQFLQGLLAKFCTSPRKKKERNDDSNSTIDEKSRDPKRPRNEATLYLSNVANALSDAVKANATHVEEECPICLERPAIHRAVLTPCGHIFCRECLLGFLRENAKPQDGNGEAAPKKSMAFHCPDGKCPCCSKQIRASRIVALSKSGPNGETLTSDYLTSMKPPSSSSVAAAATTTGRTGQSTATQFSDSSQIGAAARGSGDGGPLANSNDSRDNVAQACMAARTILDSTMKDVSSVESSKMQAVMQELDRVWQMDPGSKIIIFSQFLGFLDLMENRLSRVGILVFRLDGKLSLKGRMHVLEHFRSCDDNDKVSSKKNMPRRAAETRNTNRASLVDAATETDEDGVSPDDGNSSSIIERGTVLLMSMSAGGEGLNLVAASSVFLVDPWWNSAREDQCVSEH
jgi:SNF2 family DNA or RNA helicase